MNKSVTLKEISLVKPHLPPLDDLLPHLERIWESRQLTNGGPIQQEFEQALSEYLGINHISLLSSGTAALMIAISTLKLQGEVITTPFTSPATLQAIHWNNLKPVFADISPTDFNIDCSLIEAVITQHTSAIVPVHLFGTPCNVRKIDQLAGKYNLKVIYDAAHSFGVKINGNSICNFGDLSAMSFHATKVFNTFEGGAIVCHDEATKIYIDALKNTGLDTKNNLAGYGFNAKMNEFQSAFGLCQLKYIDEVIARRKAATFIYRELLGNVKGLRILEDVKGVVHNYSYFPILINPDKFGTDRDELYDFLKKKNITPRKYFYPLVSDFQEFKKYKTGDLPVAENIAGNILCLPLFHDITEEQIHFIVHTINHIHRK